MNLEEFLLTGSATCPTLGKWGQNHYEFAFIIFLDIAKGQLISEQIYAVLISPKMQRNIARISALASKMDQIKKVKAHYHPNY